MFNGIVSNNWFDSLMSNSSSQTIPVHFFTPEADSKAHKSPTTKCTTCTSKSNTLTWRNRTSVDICASKASFTHFHSCGLFQLTLYRPHRRTPYPNHLFRRRNHRHKTHIRDQDRDLGRQRENRYATLGPV